MIRRDQLVEIRDRAVQVRRMDRSSARMVLLTPEQTLQLTQTIEYLMSILVAVKDEQELPDHPRSHFSTFALQAAVAIYSSFTAERVPENQPENQPVNEPVPPPPRGPTLAEALEQRNAEFSRRLDRLFSANYPPQRWSLDRGPLADRLSDRRVDEDKDW